jgi:hypothetical protein
MSNILEELHKRRQGKNLHSYIFLMHRLIFKKNKMGWACGAYGGGERCAQGFGGEA